MKNEMGRIKKYTIDIAGNPKSAIKGISDPILANLEAKVQDFTDTLSVNQKQKREFNLEIEDCRNQIFD